MFRAEFIRGLMGLGGLAAAGKPLLMSDESNPVLLECQVAGFTYYEGPAVISEMRLNDSIELVREPQNKFDEDAIALYYRGQKIGFVPRRYNKVLTNILDQKFIDVRARISFLDVDPEEFDAPGITVLAAIPSNNSFSF